jgi:rod shape-determining protein MreC
MPLRGGGQRLALASFLLAGLALMVVDRAEGPFFERIRTSVADLAAPVLEVLVQPVSAVNAAVAQVRALIDLYGENAHLREEVSRLRAWHGAALRLDAENRAFRALLDYRGPERQAFVTTRVIADGRGPFVKSVLVNVGERDSVAKGQAAVTGRGLVGRISEAGDRSARILMVTDLNSRIPVLVEETRTRAILAGDNSERPLLVFLPETAGVRPGQRIVTSGDGGTLPAGLPIGVVDTVRRDAIRVRPLVDASRLEYVQIIRYDAARPPPAGEGKGTPR